MSEMMALSINQPWTWLIAHGWKDIENRSWSTRVRGTVLLHAGKAIDGDALHNLDGGRHPVLDEMLSPELNIAWVNSQWDTGGIVGEAEIVDCVTSHPSPWFVGKYGFVLRNVRPLPFAPCRGKLGFFIPEK